MSVNTTVHNIEDLRAATQVWETVNLLNETMEHGDHWIEGSIRIWNKGGWSPGVIRLEDAFWVFELDYKEQEA